MKIENSIDDSGILIQHIVYEDSDFSTQDKKDEWLNICNSCEFIKENSCGSCGCLLVNLMTYSTSKCPENNW